MHISPEFHCSQSVAMIAELAERSPIIIQNGSSNPSSRKNLDLRPYDRPYKVLLLTCVVNCTAGTPTPRLCLVVQWSVHWTPSRTTQVLVLAGARRCALKTCRKKKCEFHFQAWLNLYIIILMQRSVLQNGEDSVKEESYNNDLMSANAVNPLSPRRH